MELLGHSVHKSRTLSQQIEIVFNPDKVQILSGKGIQITRPEMVSQ